MENWSLNPLNPQMERPDPLWIKTKAQTVWKLNKSVTEKLLRILEVNGTGAIASICVNDTHLDLLTWVGTLRLMRDTGEVVKDTFCSATLDGETFEIQGRNNFK